MRFNIAPQWHSLFEIACRHWTPIFILCVNIVCATTKHLLSPGWTSSYFYIYTRYIIVQKCLQKQWFTTWTYLCCSHQVSDRRTVQVQYSRQSYTTDCNVVLLVNTVTNGKHKTKTHDQEPIVCHFRVRWTSNIYSDMRPDTHYYYYYYY